MDIRAEAARYYDLQPSPLDDISFYRNCIPSREADVLELGCGTGRVLLLLAESCRYIRGIDSSEAMLSICHQKLQDASIPKEKAEVKVGDITIFCLGCTFDFIIAPFRVFQNLETDDQVDGLFACIDKHLSPNGRCILNVFRSMSNPEGVRQRLTTRGEKLEWEKCLGEARIICHDRIPHVDIEKQVVYPELIYRVYKGNILEKETILKIVMRFYYPQQFAKLIVDHGFKILNRWGGYAGEPYGPGPELVIEFGHGD